MNNPALRSVDAESDLPIPDHQLLQLIGRGSYGDVWLARNTLGLHRAVKVVFRERFDDPRPFDREFTGVRHFEPVSREHEGLVDILHVGSDEARRFFYYVMELADNASAPRHSHTSHPAHPRPAHPETDRPSFSPQPASAASPEPRLLSPHFSYQPETLQTRMQAQGRLPALECLEIATQLVEALRYLHGRGLVHRDIKPSNVVFVDGRPKLADAGLVSQTDLARSFVGTEGFVPPEGPGTVRADVYSLGKCLYEMATGKDRCDFPSPPTSLAELPDRDLLIELNEIILKACAPEPRDRYATAEAMAADLRALNAGRSLRQRRRQRRLRAAGLAVIGLAALVAIGGQILRLASPPAPGLELVREFSMPGGWAAQGAQLGDYDACGWPELFTAGNGGLAAVSLEGRVLMERRLPEFHGDFFGLPWVKDVDGDNRCEAFASWRESTNLYVSVFNQGLFEIKRFHALGSMQIRTNLAAPQPSSTMQPVAFLPAQGPQPARLILQLTSHYAQYPRCLRAYDYETQTLLWEHPYAATPIQTQTSDLDGDGRPELLIGCYSPDNGVSLASGEDDSHTYLHVLSADGEVVWSHVMGGIYMRCFALPLCQDGVTSVYALVTRNEEAHRQSDCQLPTESRLIKLDAGGSELARYESPLELTKPILADLADTGHPLLYTADSRGSLHVFDENLNLQQAVPVVDSPYDWVSMSISGAEDLDGDGRRELVLQSIQVEFVSGTNPGRPEGKPNDRLYHHHRLHILDHRLRSLGTYPLTELSKTHPGGSVAFLPPGPDGRRQLIYLEQTVRVLVRPR